MYGSFRVRTEWTVDSDRPYPGICELPCVDRMHLRWIESTRRTRYIREYAAPDLSLVNLDQQPPRRDQTNQKPRRGLKIEEYDSFDDETVLAFAAINPTLTKRVFNVDLRWMFPYLMAIWASLTSSAGFASKIDSIFFDYMKVPEHHQVKLAVYI